MLTLQAITKINGFITAVEDAASSFFKITVQLSDLEVEVAEVFLHLLLVAMQV